VTVRLGALPIVLLLALLAGGCRNPFFLPVPGPSAPPASSRVSQEDVFFETADRVRLHGWLVSPKGGARPKGAVLFLHGNAGNVGINADSFLWLAEAGYVVFAPDYRGYGLSEGEPTFPGIHEDARAALALLPSLRGVDRERIALFGQSLGGAVAIRTAAAAPGRRLAKAVATDAAFASYRLIVRDRMTEFPLTWLTKYPASFLFDDDYSPERVVGAVAPVPLVLVHGTADRVVPYRHGEILFGKAREPKALWTVPGGGHGSGFADPEIRARLLGFLERAFGRDRRP
jgi:fermentation-respiration switch protein FrsA (DUF1100 family)